MKKRNMIEIYPRIYQVGGNGLSHADDCCVYLIDGGNAAALIDTGAGTGTSHITDNIQKAGFDIDLINTIIVTHGHIDHIGGLHYLQQGLHAQVVAHELELPAIIDGRPELTVAPWYGVTYEPISTVHHIISGSEKRVILGDLELVCVHTPGHTPGGISVYLDFDGQRILFGQDIHGPFDIAWGSNMADWRRSMQLLLNLNADILCEGHFGIYQPADAVRKYIEGYLNHYAK